MPKYTAAERFWPKVQKTDGCWLWMGARGAGYAPYGTFWMNGRYCRAHRAAYELTNGPIPEGAQVLHSCDNPQCVNPAHLSLGTQAENVAQMFDRGRAYQFAFDTRTHCKHGHELTPDNIYHPPKHVFKAHVECRRCIAAKQRAYYQRLKARREATAA